MDDEVQAPTFQGQVPKARTCWKAVWQGQTWDGMVIQEYKKSYTHTMEY